MNFVKKNLKIAYIFFMVATWSGKTKKNIKSQVKMGGF